jgi:AraC family transcriptional activator FtrA
VPPRSPGRRSRRIQFVTAPVPARDNQRIQRAQELLEATDHGIEAIAEAIGIGTATTLHRHFNRAVGVPPDAYRRTFRS